MIYKHWEYHWLLKVQTEPATQAVGPVHPWPPHCPYFGASGPVGGGVTGVVVGGLMAEVVEVGLTEVTMVVGLTEDAGGFGGTTAPELKVEPIGPNLMLEKVTEELGWSRSTFSGFPTSALHGPRTDPGLVEPTG